MIVESCLVAIIRALHIALLFVTTIVITINLRTEYYYYGAHGIYSYICIWAMLPHAYIIYIYIYIHTIIIIYIRYVHKCIYILIIQDIMYDSYTHAYAYDRIMHAFRAF